MTAANSTQPSTPPNAPGSLDTRHAAAIPHRPPQKADDTMVGTPHGGTGRVL